METDEDGDLTFFEPSHQEDSAEKETEIDPHKLAEQTLDALMDEEGDSYTSPIKPNFIDGPPKIEDVMHAYAGNPRVMPAILAKLFRALKTIQPTSIEAERAFSTCGLFVTKLRTNLNDDTLNALLIVNKHYKKVKEVQEARKLMKLPLNLQPNHVINPVMHPNPVNPIEMWREPVIQQPKEAKESKMAKSIGQTQKLERKNSPSIKSMFKKITTPGKSKGSKQEGKSAKKSKVDISPDSNTDVDESQIIIESDESLNLDIDLDQTQIQFDATPGPSRSLNIRQATPRMSQNYVCRTPKNLTPETPKSTKPNFRFVKGRRNQNDSISADPAVKKRGPVSKPVDLDETQIQFESNPGPSRRKL